MIAKEREGRTLDALLMTALNVKEILLDKRKASIYPIRYPALFLAFVFALAILPDTIHPAAFFCLIVATFVYIAFFVYLGLFISTFCRSSLKAMLVFTVTFLALGLGSAVKLEPMSDRPEQFPIRVVYYALSPLSALRQLTFDDYRTFEELANILAALVSVALVALATWCLWKLTLFHFERSTGRLR